MTDWLAFLHPIWQGVGMGLGFVTLREGLLLRKIRRSEAPGGAHVARRARHVRFGKRFLWIIGSGYFLGMGELLLLRGELIWRSAHFYFATLTLALLTWGVLCGFSMLRGTAHYEERRELHAFLLPLSLLMLVGVGVLGLRLLP